MFSYFDIPPTVALYQALYNDYFILGTAAGVIVIVLLVYLMLKYKHGEDDKVSDVSQYHEEEGRWGNWKKAILPLFVTGGVLFFVGLSTFNSTALVVPPQQSANDLSIVVVAQQWQWTFIYPNGARLANLTVPEGKTVFLTVTSIDVAHSFFLPSLDVGVDAIPGHNNTIWFTAPTSPTVDIIRCRELCGFGHATMFTHLYVIDPSQYQAWYNKLGAHK